MIDLLVEYKQSRKALMQMQKNSVDENELKLINGMLSDMDFAIDLMRTGKSAFTTNKSIEKRSAYDRRSLLDMDLFPALSDDMNQFKSTDSLNEKRKRAVTAILMSLTERQTNCFLLHYAHKQSMQQIAEELGISKRTVQGHIEVARERVKELAKGMETLM